MILETNGVERHEGKYKGFDNKKYLSAQLQAMHTRVAKFDKLYLEVGGRLTYDGHASRVLPGYNPKNKIKLLKSLGRQAGVLYCISSKDIEGQHHWSNTGMSVDKLALKEIRKLKRAGISILGVVATRFEGGERTVAFGRKLARRRMKLFYTTTIKSYPYNFKNVFGKSGFDAQNLIPTNKKVIIVTGAGANSGKMFVCLSQVYHEQKRRINSGFAKLETFPIWNLPIDHEVNIAYEAATADIKDEIMIDPFHLKAYGVQAVNYNRDIENFAILKKIITKISHKNNFMRSYKSPTDMGMNMARKGIINDELCRQAARREIIRRNMFYEKHLHGKHKEETLRQMWKIMKKVKYL